MRQVQTCDFCGADADGLYEPLPASMPASPRLALCAGCRDRLASVVDPLLDRLDDEGSLGADAPERPPPAGSGAETAGISAVAPAEEGVGESRDAGGRAKAERAGTPPGYRKVMRFLENRTLPVEREEAEQLVVDAYELSPEAVADVIDHAVQYGRLREVDEELKR